MRISYRPASFEDFDYCSKLYFAGQEGRIRQAQLDMAALVADLRGRWDEAEVRIVTLDGDAVGWFQTRSMGDAVFVVQLFVDASFQGRGIGTGVMD
jgi:GNAT superfamily N-acetyltransferase